ncbi:hypothetical protein N1851_012990 [Merluccius polli]|uniref:Uncharacterized protein n=1 Tax=Merluccius polli TaxID=89951 RepID=A0AA47MVJ3_MERPO|nr:hypothetical protein N1851_012990 [Merluccius polli]
MLKSAADVGEDKLESVCTPQSPEAPPPLHRGDRRVCYNYRGITLLSAPGTVYFRVLERRLPPLFAVGCEAQAKEFKYLGVLFTSEGKIEREMERWIGAVSAVMQALYWTAVVKRELSQKAKLLIYQAIYIPTLTYGHQLWVVTERTRSGIQAAEMSFLHRVAGLSVRDMVKSSDIRRESEAAAPLRRKEPAEVVWASNQDAQILGRPKDVRRPRWPVHPWR